MNRLSNTLVATLFSMVTAAATAGTLTAVDLNGDNLTDAYLESTANVLWYRSADVAGALQFRPAMTWADAQSFAGLSTWRLPTLVEFTALYGTLGNTGGQMNAGPFQSVTPGQYWSTSQVGANILGLDIRTGSTVPHVDGGASLFAWAVTSPVPELPTGMLFGCGTVMLGLCARRRSKFSWK